MSHRYSAIAFLIFVLLWIGIAGATENYSTVRISIDGKVDFEKLKSLRFEQVSFGDGYAEVIASAHELQQLQSLGLKYTVTITNMTAYYQSRLDNTRMMGGYRTLAEIGLALDSISNAHPDIVTPKSSIGSSIQGRPIWVIKISDNPNVDENEPEVYYYACHHAREVITPEVLIYFMRYLTNNYGTDPQVTYLVNNRELFFSPCLNPDGYHYNEETDPGGGGMWRKNRRDNGGGNWGVDINRNYGYQWGYDDVGSSPDPADETYRGTAAFSEPEIMAERLFINSRHFKVLVNYHSYSNFFLYPWGYSEIVTPDNDIFAAMGDTVSAMNGYLAGPPWQILYAVNGGAFDWEYGEQISKPKIYAVSVEVGGSSDGFWPPTNRITPLVQQNLQPNLFYARVAGNPEALRAPATPTIYSIGTVDTTHFNLYWHHFDLQNPAITFEVWQMHTAVIHRDNWKTLADTALLQLSEPGFREEDFKRLKDAQMNALTQNLRNVNEEELGKEVLQDAIFSGDAVRPPGSRDRCGNYRHRARRRESLREGRLHPRRDDRRRLGRRSEEYLDRVKSELAKLPPGAALPAPTGVVGRRHSGLEVEIIQKETRARPSPSAGRSRSPVRTRTSPPFRSRRSRWASTARRGNSTNGSANCEA